MLYYVRLEEGYCCVLILFPLCIPAVIQVNGYTPDCEVEADGATITMTTSEQFSQSDHSNGMRGNDIRPSRYLSEPQEDEWPGT